MLSFFSQSIPSEVVEVVQASPGWLDTIGCVYDSARTFMRSYGNLEQWTNGYPSRELLEADCKKGELYAVIVPGKYGPEMESGNLLGMKVSEKVKVSENGLTSPMFKVTYLGKDYLLLGVFAFVAGPDPTYAYIENGSWPDESPYHVVHRIASSPGVKHLASFCFRWCLSRYPVLRIDTHKKNEPMLHLLKKEGFRHCGTIYVNDGSPREAYIKIILGSTS